MKVKTVHYKRVKNLGNYESETFEMTTELDDDDSPTLAAMQLQEYVHYMLGIDHGVVQNIHYSEDGEKRRSF